MSKHSNIVLQQVREHSASHSCLQPNNQKQLQVSNICVCRNTPAMLTGCTLPRPPVVCSVQYAMLAQTHNCQRSSTAKRWASCPASLARLMRPPSRALHSRGSNVEHSVLHLPILQLNKHSALSKPCIQVYSRTAIVAHTSSLRH
jgi:hypothetical protein